MVPNKTIPPRPPTDCDLKRRKELYEALHPKTKRGAVNQHTKGKMLNDKLPFSKMGDAWTADQERKSFAADTAAKTGTSR